MCFPILHILWFFLRIDASGCLIYELCHSSGLNHASAKCTNPLSVDLEKKCAHSEHVECIEDENLNYVHICTICVRIELRRIEKLFVCRHRTDV